MNNPRDKVLPLLPNLTLKPIAHAPQWNKDQINTI